jgi:hypothetical protein
MRAAPMARTALAWLVSTASLSACGGTTVSRSNGGGAGTEEAKRRACAHHFTSQFSSSCRGAALPDTEISRLEPLFERACLDQLAMPGSAYTAEDLQACATATEAAECGSPDGPPLACDLRGSLPGGAPCISGTECQSGQCRGTTGPSDPGGTPPEATVCGKCAPVASLGEPCDEAVCPKNAACMTTTPSASDPGYQCTAVVVGALGSTCDHLTALCEPGAYCRQSHECTLLGGVGAPCNGTATNGCKQPYVCDEASRTCQPPGTAGAGCVHSGDRGCAVGFGCTWDGQCEPIEWSKPGEPCDDARRCLVGSCGSTSYLIGPPGPESGVCPVVIPDGQACEPAKGGTCDSTSACVDPAGTPGARKGVCKPLSSVVCR